MKVKKITAIFMVTLMLVGSLATETLAASYVRKSKIQPINTATKTVCGLWLLAPAKYPISLAIQESLVGLVLPVLISTNAVTVKGLITPYDAKCKELLY